MPLDWNTTSTYYYVDQKYKMVLINDKNKGERDSIGRTFLFYFCYGDERFIEGIESCWIKVERNWFWKLFGKKYYYQGFRYPTHDDHDLSRDHTLYSILAFKYSGYSEEALKEFTSHLRFRISKRYMFTIDSWFWIKAISGSKFFEWLFYNLEIPLMKINRFKNRLIYKIVPFEEECSQDSFVLIRNDTKPKIIVKLASKLFPIYALHILSWQLYLLPDSKRKRKLQKICLDITPKHNYVIKMLLGDKKTFTRDDVWNYKAMKRFRWTTILNPWINDRDLRMIEDEELIKSNNLEVDYVRKLYNIVKAKL